MRIAVLSDTHLQRPTPWIEAVFREHLAPADVVLHCGDMVGRELYEYFSLHHPAFHAVAGNMDEWLLADELKQKDELDLDGLRVGWTHGWGFRGGLAARVAQSFGPGYGLVCFGHTHAFEWTERDGVPLLNPGPCNQHEAEPSLALVTYEKSAPLDVERIRL
jgi:hypothetical protein